MTFRTRSGRSRRAARALRASRLLGLCMACLAGAAAPALGGPEFDGTYRGVERIAAGDSQTWAIARDFDRDGTDDFFLLLSGDRIAAFFGGAQGLRRSTIQGAFQNALHADAGFIDEDDSLDLAVAARQGAYILLGNGDGTFRDGGLLKATFFGRSVRVRDVDGDRHADILLGDQLAGEIRVFLGDGDGGFPGSENPLRVSAQAEPHFFDVADFDRDGKPDLTVVFGTDDLVGFFSGKGGGLFGDAEFLDVGSNNLFVAAGDVDGDAYPDAVVGNQGSDTVTILRGTGGGWPEVSGRLETAPVPGAVAIEDVDLDGHPDVVVAAGGEDAGYLAVHRGRGGGTFDAVEIHELGRNPSALARGDFNGDGVQDLVVSNLGSTAASLVAGARDGGLQLPVRLPLDGEPARVAAADLDGNGRLDLVVALRNVPGVQLLLARQGAGFLEPATVDGTEGGASVLPVGVAAMDVTGDGEVDLIATDLVLGVAVWPGTGAGEFGPAMTFSAGLVPGAVAGGDFDGNGTADLAVADAAAGAVLFLAGTGQGAFGEPVARDVGARPVDLAVADWNGDARLDVAVVDTAGDRVLVLAGEGDGTFRDAVEAASVPSPAAVAWVGGAEGAPDLVVASGGEGAVYVYRNDGEGRLADAAVYEGGRSPAAVAGGDLTGDGLDDIVAANPASRALMLLEANRGAPEPDGTFRRGHANDDGRLDISDPIGLLGFLFLGGSALRCPDALDANDDGRVDLSDAVFTLRFLFMGGTPPPAPGPGECGGDPTEDGLGECEAPCK